MKKAKIIVLAFISILTAFGILFYKYNLGCLVRDTVFFDIVTTFTAVFGVLAIIYQSSRSKELDEARFIVDLNKQYFENENYQNILNGLEKDSLLIDSSDIENQISRYFDFFESMYVLIKKGLIPIRLIDDLFCFRFFTVVNNKYVQEKILTPYKNYYKNIVQLHYLWKKHRLSKRADNMIPCISSDLSLLDWYSEVCKINKKSTQNKSSLASHVEIREVIPKDAKLINELHRKLHGQYQYPIDNKQADKFDALRQSGNSLVLIACINDKIVGTLQCTVCQSASYDEHPQMIIDCFIVDKSYHRKEIRTLLFQKVEFIAQSSNVRSIIWSSNAHMRAANKYFKSKGFDFSV